MKKLAILLGILALALGLEVAVAADRGTKAEAVAMVQRAVAFLQTHGREKALAEFNNPKGQFIDRDLYVFAGDMQGRCLAQCYSPQMVGKDLTELQDADGGYITKERLKLLQ
jgi:signal transduction histidine kinase